MDDGLKQLKIWSVGLERGRGFGSVWQRQDIADAEGNEDRCQKQQMLYAWYYWKEIRKLGGYYQMLTEENAWEAVISPGEVYTVLCVKLSDLLRKNLALAGVKVPKGHNSLSFVIGETLPGIRLKEQWIETFLNWNNWHLLYYGHPNRYLRYQKKLAIFRQQIKMAGFCLNDFVIVSSGILGLYGMREPTDIDIVTTEPGYRSVCNDLIDCHHHVLNTYEVTAEELVHQPDKYVYWKGIKFAALDVIYKACNNRIEETKKLDAFFIDVIRGKEAPPFRILLALKVRHYYLRTTREWKKRHLWYEQGKAQIRHILKLACHLPKRILNKVLRCFGRK